MFEKISIKIYGESHGDRVGVIIRGLEGFSFDKNSVETLLVRRRGGANGTTARAEKDCVVYAKGVEFEGDCGKIVGEIDAYIKNVDVIVPPDNNSVPRPSHADFTAYMKYGKIPSGGGRFSGRMTAPMCIVGGIARDILRRYGIFVYAYISRIGNVDCGSYKYCEDLYSDSDMLNSIDYDGIPLLDSSKADDINKCIHNLQNIGDSAGGIVECVVKGVGPGMIGDALFEGLEGKIAYSVYGIPGVKGVEFGDGFGLAHMTGSEANDEWTFKNGRPITITNRSGGINGGISNGMPITISVGFRPVPSIAKAQRSIDLENKTDATLSVKSRNDVCIVLRACPCVESAVCVALLDEILKTEFKTAIKDI